MLSNEVAFVPNTVDQINGPTVQGKIKKKNTIDNIFLECTTLNEIRTPYLHELYAFIKLRPTFTTLLISMHLFSLIL